MFDLEAARALVATEKLITRLLTGEALHVRVHGGTGWAVNQHASHDGRVRRMPGGREKPDGVRRHILGHNPATLVAEGDAGPGMKIL